jgi:hypothetical protein
VLWRPKMDERIQRRLNNTLILIKVNVKAIPLQA